MRASIVSLVLLLALPAHATWKSALISGNPADLEVLDAGMALVASGNPGGRMSIFVGSATSALTAGQSFSGDYLSATWRLPNCLIGLSAGNVVQFTGSSCASVPNLMSAQATNSSRLRRLPSGALYAYGEGTIGQVRIQRTGPTTGSVDTDWVAFTLSNANNRQLNAPLSVLSLPGGEYAAWGFLIGSAPSVGISRDAGIVNTIPMAGIADLAMFESNGVPAVMLVADGGVFLTLDALSLPFTPVTAPALNYKTVSFTAQGGSGFGMLTFGNQLFSPVPNPNALGREWVLRPEDAGFTAALVRASCFDPRSCFAITSATTGSNVFAYFNEFGPVAELRPAMVGVGGEVKYVLDAGDPDGDPIFVTWTGGSFYWDGGNSREITVFGPDAGASCTASANPANLTAIVSDGLAAHDRVITIPVLNTTPFVLPPLGANAVSFTAGDPPQTVTAAFPPDSGCTVPSLAWSIAPDGGLFGVGPPGTSVSVTPPPVFCTAGGQTFTLRGVDAMDASVSVPVNLQPWGRPFAPVFVPATVIQSAGFDAGYAPTATGIHTCETAMGFPATRLTWTVTTAGLGVTAVGSPTGLNVYSTDACATGSVLGLARRELLTTPPQQSALEGSIAVQLVPNLAPIASGTPFDPGFSYDEPGNSLRGVFSIGVNCLASRDLHAEVVVTLSDGGLVNQGKDLKVPGSWSVPVTGGCAGGSYVAVASLVDDAGMRYGPSASFGFDAGRKAARVPDLRVTEVPVTCSGGASGLLELPAVAGDCATQQFTWTQDRGPALIVAPDGGAMVSFATATNDLQAQAGKELGWSITATAGVGNSQTALRSIRLVPARFIEISHRTDVPVAREEEAVGVEVTLTNPTACAVTGVVLRESLGGLEPIEGSVRVKGVQLDAGISADVLEVTGLSLPALGSVRVTYLANVPLLSAARPSAQALLSGTDVTVGVTPKPPSTGCQCDSTSGVAFGLLALGAAAVRSRRRSR